MAPVVAPLQGVSETIRPFNGQDLDGWDYTVKFWSVDGDEIVATSTDPVITSTYCLTHQSFTGIDNDEFCIEVIEFCIENDELCFNNDRFCITNDGFCITNDELSQTFG